MMALNKRITTILPTELIDETFRCLSLPVHLVPLLRVNSYIHAVAINHLYRDIEGLTPKQSLHLLESLARPEIHSGTSSDSASRLPRRQALVKSLDIDFGFNVLTQNAYRLIPRALRKLPNLKSLEMEFSSSDNRKPLAWIFPLDAPFKLRSFTTSVRYETDLASFLESQSEIRDLSLRGLPTSMPFQLTDKALRHLTSFRCVHARPSLLEEIIRGRPVQAVSLSLYPGDEYQSLAALTRSSTPIKRLTILILDNTTPSDLLPRIATHLSSLEALHIVALVAQYDPDTLRGSSTLLSAFPSLRYLTFMASNATGSLEEEASIAACWARSCPTLRTIIMPQGKVWFPMNGRWICDTSDIVCTHGKDGKDGGSDGGAAETN